LRPGMELEFGWWCLPYMNRVDLRDVRIQPYEIS
jgi:hypothetical protein